eukprot:Rhum_TRINITY_DN4043_c0_g1::Rhum_TRINITY_DN4043_c0_g1_i1::g.12671::m.12671
MTVRAAKKSSGFLHFLPSWTIAAVTMLVTVNIIGWGFYLIPPRVFPRDDVFMWSVSLALTAQVALSFYYAMTRSSARSAGHTQAPAPRDQETCQRCPGSPPKLLKMHHCSTCDSCIADLDHHCVFIHQCIGAYNHLYFTKFLLFVVSSCVYVACLSVRALYLEDPARVVEHNAVNPRQLAAFVAAIPFALFPALLPVFSAVPAARMLGAVVLQYTAVFCAVYSRMQRGTGVAACVAMYVALAGAGMLLAKPQGWTVYFSLCAGISGVLSLFAPFVFTSHSDIRALFLLTGAAASVALFGWGLFVAHLERVGCGLTYYDYLQGAEASSSPLTYAERYANVLKAFEKTPGTAASWFLSRGSAGASSLQLVRLLL